MVLSKMELPKVSVIVPIYHSEPYLERCCRSLFSQTLDDIECLFIIDGYSSSAETIIAEVLADYPLRKDQIRILRHENNLGTSFSRQEGHDQAKGEFLYHCDSDDWLEADALKTVYVKAKSEQADLVFFDYVRHYEDTGKEVVYRSAHVEQGIISTMDGTLCNKLISKHLLTTNNLRFPVGINWGEDLCMSVLLQILAQKIIYLPKVFYHYCMHKDSFTTSIDEQKYLQLVSCPQYLEQEFAKRQLHDRYSSLLLQMKFEVKEYYLIHPSLRNIQKWLTIYPECHSAIWQYQSVPFYLKTVSWFAVNHLQWAAEFLLHCRSLIHRIRS